MTFTAPTQDELQKIVHEFASESAHTCSDGTCSECQLVKVLAANSSIRNMLIESVAQIILGDTKPLQLSATVLFMLGILWAQQSGVQQSGGIQAEIAELEKMFKKELDN